MNTSDKIFDLVEKLERNGFQVFIAKDEDEARDLFFERIFNVLNPSTVSFADSITMLSTGVIDMLRDNGSIQFIDTFQPNQTWSERVAQRKRALTVDLFLTGTNAITENGQLVNLDMVGNRVSAITFGPRNVVLFVGINKVVTSLDDAFNRVRSIAPLNVKRHPDFKTPCAVTGTCSNCNSPQRICNTWTITEKSYPKGRIKIILIQQKLGL